MYSCSALPRPFLGSETVRVILPASTKASTLTLLLLFADLSESNPLFSDLNKADCPGCCEARVHRGIRLPRNPAPTRSVLGHAIIESIAFSQSNLKGPRPSFSCVT